LFPLSALAAAAWAVAAGATSAPEQGEVHPKVRPPAVVRRVDAIYPPDALAAGLQADVTLEVTVGVDGTISDVQVASSGGASFDSAAIDAIRNWVFTPAAEGETPVAVRIRVPFAFRLPAPVQGPAPMGGQAPPLPSSPRVPAPPGGEQAPTSTPDSHQQGPASSPSTETTEPLPPPGSAAPPAQGDHAEEELEATVRGRAQARSRGTADYEVSVGKLSVVPRKAADELLKLAPGILLTNEGGEGHASQIFLRGFDARDGQDLEISVAGVPVNEAGNLHGNGYADLNFVIPEVVSSLRVLEGPFDPRQGNFAVAGSAEYELGLEERGVGVQVGSGSYGTRRLLTLWGPPGASRGTFGAAEVYQTDGFGQNRDAVRSSAIGQYEGRLGADSIFRLTLQGYSGRWHSAGVIREDDYAAGRIGFFDTYDPNQGGDATRFSISGEIEGRGGTVTYRNQAFLILSTSRLRENFTGFLLDPQEPLQSLHPQRGDLIDRSSSATTIGARGFARTSFELLGRRQELEVGYLARYDVIDGTQYRIAAATGHPYHDDLDLLSRVADIGVYSDLSLSPLSWLTLRGGVRAEFLSFDILNRCAVQSVAHPSPSNPPGDASCLSQDQFNQHREPVQMATSAGSAVLPRASILVTPLPRVTLSGSYGRGVRSIDPQYVVQDAKTPFASATASEVGAAYGIDAGGTAVAVRTAGFKTRVDKDLVFSESAGRNTLGGSSTRLGWLLATRLTGGWFDESLNATVVKATFDDTHLLIPYVPDLVVRSDTSLWRDLPWRPGGRALTATGGLGITYVGRRPLPYADRSDPIFTVDASASLTRRPFKLALSVTNLLDARYRLGEYNYASDFHSQPAPTLVPTRTFTAGAPRIVMLTLEVLVGGAP